MDDENKVGMTPREQVLALVKAIADKHDLTSDELLMPDRVSGARGRKRIEARHEAIYEICIAFPRMSTTKLGQLFSRDHSAIIYARRRHQRRLAQAEAQRT